MEELTDLVQKKLEEWQRVAKDCAENEARYSTVNAWTGARLMADSAVKTLQEILEKINVSTDRFEG